MGELVLVLGGARSGKSRFAERLAAASGPAVVYLATGQLTDDEMAVRIARHQAERPAGWRTVEEGLQLADAVAAYGSADAILVDCLTFWLSNRLFAADGGAASDAGDGAAAAALEEEVAREIERLAAAAAAARARVIVVSNEVGQGLVPAYPLGRLFRDLQGRANQWVAARAARVFVTWAGIPVEIKSLAYPLG